MKICTETERGGEDSPKNKYEFYSISACFRFLCMHERLHGVQGEETQAQDG